jgi:phage shock protein C
MLLTGLGMFTRPKRKKKKPVKVMSDGRATDVYGLERKKKLFKSRTNRRIAGVCGGIADYLGMDATMVRILFVIFTFIGSGSPVLVYLALSVILPKAPKSLEP